MHGAQRYCVHHGPSAAASDRVLTSGRNTVAEEGHRMPNYLDIEVALEGVQPRIWRRFLLRDRATFLDLHHAIQDACGWENAHLFAFRDGAGNPVAGVPDDFGFGEPDPDAAKVQAGDYLKRHRQMRYEYDFGDSWEHAIELKQVVSDQERFTRRLLDGARAFPPEDCGGQPGYEDLVAVAAGEQAVYHDTDELRQWCAGWDPESFDVDSVRSSFDR